MEGCLENDLMNSYVFVKGWFLLRLVFCLIVFPALSQMSLLAESLAQERQEIQVRKKAQEKVRF